MSKLDQKGDIGTITLAIIAVAIIVVAASVAITRSKNAKTDTKTTQEINVTSSPSPSTASPATRVEFTTKYEKFMGSYPQGWTVTNTPIAATADQVGPSDKLVFKKNNYEFTILSGASQLGGGCDQCKVLHQQTISSLGRQVFVYYFAEKDSSNVNRIVITDIANDMMGIVTGKNINDPTDSSKKRPIYFTIGNATQNGFSVLQPKPLDEYKNASEIKDIVSIVESLKY